MGYVVGTLDVDVLRNAVFPTLAARYFGDEYDVAVVDGRGETLYSNTELDVSLEPADAREKLFSLARSFGPTDRFRDVPPDVVEARRDLGGPKWEVLARHRAGSLGAAVRSARARNLAVSFGILGILAASVLLVAVSTRRATELNNRKLEFIAGVSHELRTPVAVVCAAGQNLADGSVSDPEQVKRYGAFVESEGRRLDALVEQVLELAGIQSQKRPYRRERVLVESLVEQAVADSESLRAERDVPIRTRFETQEAVMIGDPDALRRALGNIIRNAVKHGGEDNAVDIRVESRGADVAVVVSDRGPGIPTAEREHIFDAFYRGGRAQKRQVPGSGLGLSLVRGIAREHGGRGRDDRGVRWRQYVHATDSRGRLGGSMR